MRKSAGHSSCSVMFGEAVGCEHMGEFGITGRLGIRIIWTLFLIRRRVCLLLIQRILDNRFERLVVRGQRTIFQPARHIDPAHAVGMQRERSGATERFYTMAPLQICRGVGWHFFVIIWDVGSGPVLLISVPPNELFPLAPGLAIGARRSAVVNNSAIIRPGKTPAMAKRILRVSLPRSIAVAVRKHAAIDPRSARR